MARTRALILTRTGDVGAAVRLYRTDVSRITRNQTRFCAPGGAWTRPATLDAASTAATAVLEVKPHSPRTRGMVFRKLSRQTMGRQDAASRHGSLRTLDPAAISDTFYVPPAGIEPATHGLPDRCFIPSRSDRPE